MKKIYVAALAIVLLPLSVIAVAFAPSWTYEINTVQFVASNPTPETDPTSEADQPAANIWIDTRIALSGLFGGTIRSNAPFDVAFEHTDIDRLYAGAEISSISITYDDQTVEPATDKLKLPLLIKAREHESFNSMAGGEIVKSEYVLLMGRVPGVITREEPFTLKLNGHFIKHDGTKVPFEIDQHYDLERETGEQSWVELMSNC